MATILKNIQGKWSLMSFTQSQKVVTSIIYWLRKSKISTAAHLLDLIVDALFSRESFRNFTNETKYQAVPN